MVGQSLKTQLTTSASGRIDADRDHIVLALERHTIARPNYLGYPMRALRTDDFLLVHNFEPSRWPAGDPDYESIHQGIFGDIDAGPSKDFVLSLADDPRQSRFYKMATARRPAFELFDLKLDQEQLLSVADDPVYLLTLDSLNTRLETYLKNAGDPRAFGKSPWDQNIYYFGDLPDKMPKPDPDRWNIE